MEKSITITYNIVNPGEMGSAVTKAVIGEIRRIHDAVNVPLDGVVINCHQTGKKPDAMPSFDELTSLQSELQIGEVAINKSLLNRESCTSQEILKKLRRLHDEFGDQISELEDDYQTATSALESIYAQMEMQLDALEDAIGGDEKGHCPLWGNDQSRLR